MNWKSEDEINETYVDHILTLQEAGIDHDPDEIAAAWEEEIALFRDSQEN